MKRTELVAIGITKVGEIQAAGAAFTYTGRILDRCAPVLDTTLVPGISFFGAIHRKTDRAPVCKGSRLAVDGLRDQKAPAAVCIDQAPLWVLHTGLPADGPDEGIVERPRPGDVVTPDHDMTEHSVFPFLVAC